MTRYAHRDGDRAASRITVPGVGSVSVEDGVFECEPTPDVHEKLLDLGHTPLDGDDPPDEPVEETDGDEDNEADGDDEAEAPAVSEFNEQQLVEDLDYREKQAIASQYDHINGNASEDELTEALIKQRREEVDDGS